MTTFTEAATSKASFNGGTYQPDYFTVGNIASGFSAYAVFVGVTIPQGATITSATLTPAWGGQGGTPVVVIYGAAADSTTSGPTTASAYYGGARTSASTAYSTASTADVTAIVQEVVNRAGWASGNGLMLYVRDNGSPAGAYDSAGSPSLSVTYTPSGGTAATAAGSLSLSGTATTKTGGAASGALSLSGAVAAKAAESAAGSLSLAGSVSASGAFAITVLVAGATTTVSWPAAGASYVIERDGANVAFGYVGTTYTDTPGSGSHTYRVGVLA